MMEPELHPSASSYFFISSTTRLCRFLFRRERKKCCRPKSHTKQCIHHVTRRIRVQVVGDGTMAPGWDLAIRTMAVGERSIFRLTDPSLGYGSYGVPPLIPPDSMLEFDIDVIDAQEPTLNIDFDSIAMADSTPVSHIDNMYLYML
jgi:FKBP-type peptidyl-prolyl cis-trans isomerase